MKRKPPRTPLEHCFAHFGQRRGGFVAAHVAQWAITAYELGHLPTTVEYADYWALDERTGWRHRAEIDTVFGEHWPEVISIMVEHMDERMSPRAVTRLALPSLARS